MGTAKTVYELTRSGSGMKIRFSSSMDHIDNVCTTVTLYLKSLGDVLNTHVFSVNLVIREGLTNAVRHGNKNDPGKTVLFSLDVEADRSIRVRIEDQGEGFDWERIRHSNLAEDADHGRGMPIMEAYFDHCQYNTKGNILYLEKRIRSQV